MTDKLFIPRAREGNKRWYCGPYVMGAVTGYSFEVIRTVLNKAKRRPLTTGVCGVQPWELQQAFRSVGWERELLYSHKDEGATPMKLKDWLKTLKPDDDQFYVVYITRHYVAVQGGMFIDTFSTHKVNTAYAPHQNKKVKEVYCMYKR